jgi:hypothetical protein
MVVLRTLMRYGVLFTAPVLGCSSNPATSADAGADASNGTDGGEGGGNGSCYGPTPSNNTPECPAGYCYVCGLLDVNPQPSCSPQFCNPTPSFTGASCRSASCATVGTDAGLPDGAALATDAGVPDGSAVADAAQDQGSSGGTDAAAPLCTTTGCPDTKPTSGTPCTGTSSCLYADNQCTCEVGGMWQCGCCGNVYCPATAPTSGSSCGPYIGSECTYGDHVCKCVDGKTWSCC